MIPIKTNSVSWNCWNAMTNASRDTHDQKPKMANVKMADMTTNQGRSARGHFFCARVYVLPSLFLSLCFDWLVVFRWKVAPLWLIVFYFIIIVLIIVHPNSSSLMFFNIDHEFLLWITVAKKTRGDPVLLTGLYKPYINQSVNKYYY